MTDQPAVRVRFAPSPTGFLHVGGARTALFNWLFARHYGGVFILRIEDTDLQRSTEESTKQILESLQWLGLNWDEGPYLQSQRAPRHREAAAQLIEAGHAYRDFTPEEEVERQRSAALAAKENFVYRGADRDLAPEESQRRAAAGESFCVRFRVPESGHTIVEDGLAGRVEFDHAALSDFVILRPDGSPVYNFACAVDDVDMRITHVIRGQDHLSNTPRQVLIIRALGAEPPRYTHVPLILRAGKKMSKRDAEADPDFPVSVHARRDLGYLPEATVNFLALLGWAYGADEEICTVEQAIERFDGRGLTAAPANFDEDKYTWMNGYYIRNLPKDVIVARARTFLEKAGFDLASRGAAWLEGVIALEIERVKYLREFPVKLAYFFRAPEEFEPKGVQKLFLKAGAAERLRQFADRIEATAPWTLAAIEAGLGALCESTGVGFGQFAQPARLALTGRTASPGMFEVLFYLGKEESVRRLREVARGIEEGRFGAPSAAEK